MIANAGHPSFHCTLLQEINGIPVMQAGEEVVNNNCGARTVGLSGVSLKVFLFTSSRA